MGLVDYFVSFGSGDPSANTGLLPTFTVFRSPAGLTTPPSISELATTGLFHFQYEPFGGLAFVIDGATTGLVDADRYVVGAVGFDDTTYQGVSFNSWGITNIFVNVSTIGAGVSIAAFGVTLNFQNISTVGAGVSTIQSRLGTPSDAIGDASTNPTTIFGFLLRAENVAEGQSLYTKSSGVWDIKDKTGATTLASRTIADTVGTITKS